ncbi:MAG: hypothetical protein J3T61_05710, partial [Candidatus Brocadiales bacterium]|nr:hypothetical protein [Candidatus Bathyanammoxibius sp.]
MPIAFASWLAEQSNAGAESASRGTVAHGIPQGVYQMKDFSLEWPVLTHFGQHEEIMKRLALYMDWTKVE